MCVRTARARTSTQGAQLATIPSKYKGGLQPSRAACFDVAGPVADHPRRRAVASESPHEGFEQAGLWFSTVACADERWVAPGTPFGMVKARLETGDTHPFLRESRDERIVRPAHRCGGDLPLRGTWLVGRDGQREAGVLQGAHSADRVWKKAKLRRMKRDGNRPRLLVADYVDDRAVAIEDRDRGHLTLSHLVEDLWSFGWLTSKCHTTAQNPSV